jgi:cell division protein FtsZ
MSINIDIPERQAMIPKISVLGVGGAGGNAVNNMIDLKLTGVNFLVANTDAQALINSKSDTKIQLGENTTKGLGAGSSPEVGARATEESEAEILAHLKDSHMVFITAGMGGGTGTGSAPVIAKICRENNILTVGVITKPFHFEGSYRMRAAELGVLEMQKYVDTLIVIPNQNLFHKANEKTTFAEAFNMVDNVLYSGIKGITDLMTMPGLINLDFADIRTIMGNMGKAMMGTGEASGDKRALEAAEAAISNPLLDNASMKGASGVLINISGGLDMTLFEADEAAQRIRDEVAQEANIIFGSTFDKELDDKVRVSVVATGIDNSLVKKPVLTKSAQEAQESKNSFVEEQQKIKTEVASKGVENSFIPPQAVSPEDVLHNQSQQQRANLYNQIKTDNVVQFKNNQLDNSNPAYQTQETQAKEAVAAANVSNIALGNSAVSSVQRPVEQSNPNSNQASTKKPLKPKKLGGIFSFFKDMNGNEKTANVTECLPQSEEKEGNIAEYNSSNNDNLTVSEDILNVPTFVRNKNEQ